MLKSPIWGTLFCLLSACAVMAQELPKPGPEHKRLAEELVGTWDCVMDVGGQKSKGSVSYKSICDGMWLASEFEGELGGAKFHGHGLDGYDLHQKKYIGIWVDSWTSSPLRMAGDYDPKTKRLVMTGDSVSMDGKPEKFKAITETKDKDHFTFKMLMIQPDGSEQLSFSIEYTRKK